MPWAHGRCGQACNWQLPSLPAASAGATRTCACGTSRLLLPSHLIATATHTTLKAVRVQECGQKPGSRNIYRSQNKHPIAPDGHTGRREQATRQSGLAVGEEGIAATAAPNHACSELAETARQCAFISKPSCPSPYSTRPRALCRPAHASRSVCIFSSRPLLHIALRLCTCTTSSETL